MKTKTIILTALLLFAAMGAKAQVDVTKVDATHYTFTMPAYDVEITTELWYKLDEAADNSSLSNKTNVFLKRTLQAGGWNTFCAPFDIDDPEDVFGADVQVKELSTASISDNTLTLIFADASGIEAGKPYLIKLNGDAPLNLAADGKEFEGVTQSYTAIPTTITGVVTFQPVLVPESMTANDQTKLFVTGGNALTYPNTTGNINAFRAYFKLLGGAAAPTAFRMDFGEETVTGILNVEATEMRQTGIYTIDGRKLDRLPNIPGVYIVNGQKVINY